MTSSQSDITVNGLNLTVYGLLEYKRLPQSTPVAVLFALHGRLQTKSTMETISQVLCTLNNDKQQPGQRHLLVVTFDHLNHGSRLTDKKANFAWKEGKHENPSHAFDMWSMVHAGSRTVTELIDVLEYHLFGATHRPVEVWGCLGFSMGAHATFLAAANDPRISVQISIVGTSDYLALMRARWQEGGFPEEYLPAAFCTMVQQHYDGLGGRLASKKVLMINGKDDQLVPGRFNDGLAQDFDVARENRDWARISVPHVGHAWCPAMFELSTAWCRQWMVSANDSFYLSLPTSGKL